jgi:MFS family permease
VTGSSSSSRDLIESPYAWMRLMVALAIGTIGGVGMWSIVVALPTVQAEFGVDRAGASLPYTATMVGFMFGGIAMGKLADRFGVIAPVLIGTVALAVGYVGASYVTDITTFAIVYGLTIGMFGSSATFGPLVADVSFWFDRNRGFAIALCACGNYLSGTLWPPFIEHFISTVGWRETHVYIGIFCLVTLLPLTLFLRKPPPAQAPVQVARGGAASPGLILGMKPNTVQAWIMLMGIGCCVAMSMPQVHIVAWCTDLGYGPARGAEMLSLMLGFGIISRLASGWILDRIGGLATVLLGVVLQGMALALYLPADGLMSLYVVSSIFGLVQGGIVPSYAYIVRELYPAKEAGLRVSLSLSTTLAGMALGGWLSGVIFDATGSYRLALVNGIGWGLMTAAVSLWLLLRQRRERAALATT